VSVGSAEVNHHQAPADGNLDMLTIEGLTAGYSKVPVIQDISLKVRRAEVVAVIGPNGSGKSTMLKAIVGLIGREGRVILKGQDVSEWPTNRIIRAGLAYVPQVENVFPSLSVTENLEAGAFFRRDQVRRGIERVYSFFPDLQLARKKRAGELSGGQQKMLAIGRGLMSEPAIVLLDEPSGGLAPIYMQVVWQKIKEIAAAGTSIVLVEQSVQDAIAQASVVHVFISGRSVLTATPAELANHDLAALFLGGIDRIGGETPPQSSRVQ